MPKFATTVTERGAQLLQDPRLNKSTAFTETEREALALIGLVPEAIDTEDTQVQRVMHHLGHKPTDLEPLYLPDGALGYRRDAVLSGAHVRPGTLSPNRLRPNRGRGLPEIRPYLPATQRHVSRD
jgi:hypothetical protein